LAADVGAGTGGGCRVCRGGRGRRSGEERDQVVQPALSGRC